MDAKVIFLQFVFIFVVFSSPVTKDLGSESASSKKEEVLLPSIKQVKISSGLSADCESLCKTCNATGKLQDDGSCTCLSDNGGEVSCLRSEKHGETEEDSSRDERCAGSLRSGVPNSLQDALGGGIRDLTPSEKAEEFRKRVEALRTVSMVNLQKALEKIPKIKVEPLKTVEIQSTSLQKTPAVEIPSAPKTQIFELPPSLKLPVLKNPIELKLPSGKTLPSLKTPIIEIPTLSKSTSGITIPSLPKFSDRSSSPKLSVQTSIPKLPSGSKSQLPVSPFLEKTVAVEIPGQGKEEIQQSNIKITTSKDDKNLQAPNPCETPKTNTVLPTSSVNFNLPGLTPLPKPQVPTFQRTQYLASPRLSLRLPPLPQTFSLPQLGGPVLVNGYEQYGRVLRSSKPYNIVQKTVARNVSSLNPLLLANSTNLSLNVTVKDLVSKGLPADNHSSDFEVTKPNINVTMSELLNNDFSAKPQLNLPKTSIDTFKEVSGGLGKVEETTHSYVFGKKGESKLQGLTFEADQN